MYPWFSVGWGGCWEAGGQHGPEEEAGGGGGSLWGGVCAGTSHAKAILVQGDRVTPSPY